MDFSRFDDLFRRSRSLLEQWMTDLIRHPVEGIFSWARRRIIGFVIATVLMSVSVIFLLIAFQEGLEAIGFPKWGSYGLMGLLGGLTGLLLLRYGAPKKP